MKRRTTLISALGVLSALGLLSSAAFSTAAVNHATTARKGHKVAPKVTPQQLTLYVFRGKEGILGASDGKTHDTVVPSTFGVKVGVPVQVTVINYDEGTHSITSPALNLNPTIKAGTQFTTAPSGAGPTEILNQVVPGITHFTLTVKKAGIYRWYCSMPCDAGQNGWAMTPDARGPGQNGFMSGSIVAVG